ncbi:MAG: hypothetical protein R6X06_06690 [Gammaproteobacteria bacterium]
MSERIAAPHVGAPDPEKRTSLIAEEAGEDFDVLGMEAPETPVCYFNDILYREHDYVCSGDELLICRSGIWVQEGSCDPDNP